MDTTSRNDPAATLAASFMWPLALARSWSSLLSFAPQSLTQPINPGWTLGNVINVTENNSNAPDTEREIVEQHSYGRQLGHITDALAVMVKSQLAEQPELSDDSRKCLDDFLTLAAKIDGIKRGEALKRVERVARDLAYLKSRHPDAYDEARKRLASTFAA